jgi:hypothetical protein
MAPQPDPPEGTATLPATAGIVVPVMLIPPPPVIAVRRARRRLLRRIPTVARGASARRAQSCDCRRPHLLVARRRAVLMGHTPPSIESYGRLRHYPQVRHATAERPPQAHEPRGHRVPAGANSGPVRPLGSTSRAAPASPSISRATSPARARASSGMARKGST